MKKIFRFKVILIVLLVGFVFGIVLDNFNSVQPAVNIDFPNKIQEVLPSIAHIMNETRGLQGSGVAITPNIIATARHVVKFGIDFTITLNNGDVIKATKAISHKDYDVGFIKLDESILKPAKFGSVKECVLGQPVFVIGSPYGKLNFNSVTLGIVSGLDRDWEGIDPYSNDLYGWTVAFTTDAGGHPGNSGCPIFSMDGVVRGIIVGGFSPVLVCSMPTDLFINDIGMIQLMFGTDNYKIEKIRPFNDGME